MGMEEALETFVAESQELLEVMEDRLLDLDKAVDKGESISSIFRAAHTIKGSAGLFGFDSLVAFTHIAESVLDKVRNGNLDFSEPLVSHLLEFKDHVYKSISSIENGVLNLSKADEDAERAIVAALSVYLADDHAPVGECAGESASELANDGIPHAKKWLIRVAYGEDVLRNGMDPLSFIRYLSTLGTITAIITHYNAIPALDKMDSESCYLKFDMEIEADVSKSTLIDAFEFVKDDCELTVDELTITQEAPLPTSLASHNIS